MKRFCGTPAERFDVKWTPEPNCGCWLWLAHADRKGYGTFEWSSGTKMQAHRASWAIHHGEIPENLHVLHKCDVPSCVNPDHLFLGTNADNVADRVAKGRSGDIRGERHPGAILTNEMVIAIRSAAGSYRQLAARFGLKKSMIADVRSRRVWKHLP